MGIKYFTTLLEAVQAHAVECPESGCWNWKGGTQSKAVAPVPVMRWRGTTNSVRRFLALEKFGERALTGPGCRKRVASYSCGNPACVCPDHVVVITRERLAKRVEATAHWRKEPARLRQQTRFARENFAKLDANKAQRIREDERPQKAIAADYGVSQATVSSIKRGRTWKDHDTTNPFRGLMR